MKAIYSKFLTALLIPVLAAPVVANGQGFTTDPVGAVNIVAPAGTVALSKPFVEAIEFQSQISGNTSDTVTVAGEDLSEYATGDWYVEFLTGSLEGSIMDVTAALNDTLTLEGDLTALNGDEVIAVRAHSKLSDIIPAGTLSPFSDSVTLFDDNGNPLSYLADGAGGWVDAITFSPVSEPVVRPANAILVNSNGFSLTLIGSVKVGPTVIPITGGAVNIVGSLDPVADLPLEESNVSSVMSPFSDTVSVINNDGSASLQSALYNGAGGFVDATDFVTPVNPVIPSVGAVILQPASDQLWELPSAYDSVN